MSEEREKIYKPDELPTSITRQLFVRYGMGKYNAGQLTVDEFNLQSDCFAAVVLHEVEITIEIPAQNKEEITKKALGVLEAEKKAVMAENHARLSAVQDKIDNLLAIEFKPAGQDAA